MLAEVYLHPEAKIAHTVDNVQGTFQICKITGRGMITLIGDHGFCDVDIGTDLSKAILECLTPPPQQPERQIA